MYTNNDGTVWRYRLPGFEVLGRRDDLQGYRPFPAPRRRAPGTGRVHADVRHQNGPPVPAPPPRPTTIRAVNYTNDRDPPPLSANPDGHPEALSQHYFMLESFLSSTELRTARLTGTGTTRRKAFGRSAPTMARSSLLRRKVIKPGMNRSLMAPPTSDEESSSEDEDEDEDESDAWSDDTITNRHRGTRPENANVNQAVRARKGIALRQAQAQQTAAQARAQASATLSPSPAPQVRINTARKTAKTVRRDRVERLRIADTSTSEDVTDGLERTPSTSLDEDETTDHDIRIRLDETGTPEETPVSSEEEEEEEESVEPADTRRKGRALHIMSLKRLRAKQPELTHPNGISTYVNPLERSARLQTFISHRAMDFAHRLFLPRNLRRGFNIHHSDRALRCLPPHDTNSGIWRIEYHAGPQVLTPDMMDLEKWGWRCPLCEFHGNFGSKERVARHLDSDHGECGVEWAVGHAEGWVWRAKITFVKQEEGGNVKDWVNFFIIRKREENLVFQARSVPVTPRPHPLPLIAVSSSQKYRSPTIETSSREMSSASSSNASRTSSATPFFKQEDDDTTPVPQSPTPEGPLELLPIGRVDPELEPQPGWDRLPPHEAPRYGYRRPRAPGTLPTILDPSQRHAPIETCTIANATFDGKGKEPVAKAPYLGYISQDGARMFQHSAWPGGPRIFNLLHLLDTKKEFGVLAWAVLLKEDGIFEEPMHDHDKVIACLWCRWIFLNKNRLEFIADPARGVRLWLGEYHWMIGLAAGKDALWNWLWVLTKIKMLDAIHHKDLLGCYDGLVENNKYKRKMLNPIQ